MLTPEMHVMGARSLLLSPDGRCKTFDRGANGFVRGEGCGLLVLKRLADALVANDPVLAVIRGIAINQDGRTNGISAPSGLSQQRVLRRALHNALLEPSRVTFVETHGTGTVVGDTIEVEALAEVYGAPSATGPCYLGAVKTNVGHLEGAAGAAGVIKMVLCLRHGRIPPNLHFRDSNPHLALERTRFRLPLEVQPWTATDGPRRGAVSSFGLGGTNGHVILEEAPQGTAGARDVERPRRTFHRERYWLAPREAAPREATADLLDRRESQTQPLRQRLRDTPPDRRVQMLEEFVRSTLAGVLGNPPAAVPREEGFATLGLDSLGAIELRTELERALESSLPATLAFDYPTVAALVAHLTGLLAEPSGQPQAPPDARDLDGLTRDELAALLADELGAAEGGNTP
jgi:acyl transferase domain-containing protein